MKKPSISRHAQQRHASPGESLFEFSFPSGRGGLISLSTNAEGEDVVNWYRVDSGIVFVASQHSHDPVQS